MTPPVNFQRKLTSPSAITPPVTLGKRDSPLLKAGAEDAVRDVGGVQSLRIN